MTERIAIPITTYCPICDKYESHNTWYIQLKDGSLTCLTCTQCRVARLVYSDRWWVDTAEYTLDEYLSEVKPFKLSDNIYMVQKPVLFTLDGVPINNLAEWIKKKLALDLLDKTDALQWN